MRIYPDPQKWAERISKVPMPLRNKALKELDGLYEQKGFRALRNGKDAHGTYVDVDVKPGTSLADVHSFLQDFDAAAVTIEPLDLPRVLGKNLMSLSMQRHAEIVGQPEELTLIEPDSLADGLAALRMKAVNAAGTEPITAEQEEFILTDLVNEGILTAEEVAAQDKWLETPADHIGLKQGSYGASEFDNDMGEFAPDAELIEWEEGR